MRFWFCEMSTITLGSSVEWWRGGRAGDCCSSAFPLLPNHYHHTLIWARRNGYDITLLESFTLHQDEDVWNDFVAVFAKGKYAAEGFVPRMLSGLTEFTNGIVNAGPNLLNATSMSEDMARRLAAAQVSSGAMVLTWPSAIEGGAEVSL